MRKLFLKFMCFLLALFAFPLTGTAETLTVANGTTTNQYVPFYGYYLDVSYGDVFGQMIYPEADLGLSEGDQITAITFYANGDYTASCNFQVSFGTTNATTISSQIDRSSLTKCFEGALPKGNSEITIELTTPYTYEGGNLIIDVYRPSRSSDCTSYGFAFYGITATNGSSYYQSGNLTGQQAFLPKITIEYIAAGPAAEYAAKVTPATTAENPLDFGRLITGDSKALNVTVKNTGTNTFTPSVSISGSAFTSSYTAAALALGATATIPVTFNPTTDGEFAETMTINCGEAGTFTVYLSGSAAMEKTICEGNQTNEFVPIYGYYYDNKQINQIIYPASMLTDLVGKNLKGLTFEASTQVYSGGKYNVSLGTTEQTEFEEPTRLSGLTTVATDRVAVSGGTTLSITFDQVYPYSGGNLVIEFEVTESGSYGSGHSYYKGINTTNYPAFNSYGSTIGTSGVYDSKQLRKFLPQVTFAYEEIATPVIPVIEVDPEELTITVEPYTLASATFTVTGTDLTGNITLAASGSNFAVTPTTITPAEAANGKSVTVTFSKEIEGTFDGTITLTSEGAETKTVNVTANVSWPMIRGTVTPSSLNFETYAGIPVAQTISIENTGNRPFTPAFNVAAPFSIAAATEIAVGETKTFDVTYAPTAEGTDDGTLAVNINNTITEVTLNGTAKKALKEETVEDGEEEMEQLPIYGAKYDYKQINQMIYPANDLAAFAGKKIVSITFYSPRIYYSGGKYNVSVGLTDQSVYEEDKTRITGLTQVATDLVAEASNGETELKINFSEPFTYEAGKNLVIDFEVTEPGSIGADNTSFYGSGKGNYVAYNSYTSGNTYNGQRHYFLPKVTFAYEDDEIPATPVITVEPATVDAFTTEVGTPVTATVNVTGENLTDAITATVSGDNADYFTATLENGVLTITYNPTEAGNHTATLTLSSTGAEDVTIALTGTASEVSKELTIAEDGTPISSNNMSPLPVEGSYFDSVGTYGQIIYNKSDLAPLAGKDITKVKYYSNTTFDAATIGGVVLELYLMESENDVMPIDGLTFSGSAIGEYEIQGGEKEVVFNLTEPVNYSGDNNLAIQVRVKTAKSWHNIAWIGKTVTSGWISYYKYGDYYGRSNTLPKTTFSYTGSDTPATPVITVDPATVDPFSTKVGTPVTATVNVTGENLTDDITATVSGDNADYFTAALENGVLTITYNPTEVGNHTATLTLSSTGAENVTIDLTGTAVEQTVTGIYNVTATNVVGVKYYNAQGVESDTPFDGVNIEVTTYVDGTRTTRKVLR